MLGNLGPERRKAFGIKDNNALFDPRTNARAARTVYGWQGFNAWSVYNHGTYKKYLGQAQKAADSLPSYAIGAYEVGGDQIAMVHQGEMILPRKQAQRIRDYVRRQQLANNTAGATARPGGGGSRSVTVHLTMPIQTVTGITTADAQRLVNLVALQLESDARIAAVGGGDE
jgi:hypothetical protein